MCEPPGEVGFLEFPGTGCVKWCLRRWSWWLSCVVTHRTAAERVCIRNICLEGCLLKFAPGSEGMYINACQMQWKPLQLTACLSLQQTGHQTSPSVPWTSCGCWVGGRSWLGRKKNREITMKTQHSLPASFPLAPALPVLGELWFPHPRSRQERFPAVPMPHRGQREPEVGQPSVLPLCPSP